LIPSVVSCQLPHEQSIKREPWLTHIVPYFLRMAIFRQITTAPGTRSNRLWWGEETGCLPIPSKARRQVPLPTLLPLPPWRIDSMLRNRQKCFSQENLTVPVRKKCIRHDTSRMIRRFTGAKHRASDQREFRHAEFCTAVRDQDSLRWFVQTFPAPRNRSTDPLISVGKSPVNVTH